MLSDLSDSLNRERVEHATRTEGDIGEAADSTGAVGGGNGGEKAQSSNRTWGSGEVRECGSAKRAGLRANGKYEHTFGVRG